MKEPQHLYRLRAPILLAGFNSNGNIFGRTPGAKLTKMIAFYRYRTVSNKCDPGFDFFNKHKEDRGLLTTTEENTDTTTFPTRRKSDKSKLGAGKPIG